MESCALPAKNDLSVTRQLMLFRDPRPSIPLGLQHTSGYHLHLLDLRLHVLVKLLGTSRSHQSSAPVCVTIFVHASIAAVCHLFSIPRQLLEDSRAENLPSGGGAMPGAAPRPHLCIFPSHLCYRIYFTLLVAVYVF